MADVKRIEIVPEGEGWRVLLVHSDPSLKPQSFYCATREQADLLSAVMSGESHAGGPRLRATPPPIAGSGLSAAGLAAELNKR